jgi:Zn-dependent protease
MVKCDTCGVETFMPFKCNYCGKYFCEQHRLPEFHSCTGAYAAAKPTIYQGTYSSSGGSYNYASNRVIRSYWFSKRELRDLAIGSGIILLTPLIRVWSFFLQEPAFVSIYIVILMLAFILHELAHKFAAQRSGLWAEFRLSATGILFTIMSFLLFQTRLLPIMVIAPGAVMIAGMLNQKESGEISIAGPAINLAQAFIYLTISLIAPDELIKALMLAGIAVNSGLALFNLIPFGVFDGEKIFKWDKRVWVIAVAIAGIMFFFIS